MTVDELQPGLRRFLFLQGPHGSFFRKLADQLERAGHGIERINFNGGDRRDWGPGGFDYRRDSKSWPAFVDRFIEERGVTDLVLYGDCRPMHRAAHGVARLRGCRINVLEEGYIRPDYLTLERDGVNGNSLLPDTPDWYLDEAKKLGPVPDLTAVPASFERRIRQAMRYQLATTFGRLHFRHYETHRPRGAGAEAIGWFVKWARRKSARRSSARVLETVWGRPYFCFPLQLTSDYQIRMHSPFADMAAAISYVVQSFAKYAAPEMSLVLKQHPLAADLVNYKYLVDRAATKNGVAERVVFVEEADIAVLVERAQGVVTVNSTTGTLALRSGVPTIVLGQAVYDIPRITHQGSLDSFWNSPVAPEAAVYAAFCRVLIDRCLVHGGYLSEDGLQELVDGTMARLMEEPATLPVAQDVGH